MSKVFDALNRVRGGVAETILPMVGPLDASRPEENALEQPAASAAAAAADPHGADQTGLAAVRRIPLRVAAPSPLLPFDGTQWEASEQYRIVRTKIVQHPKQPRTIVVSSGGPGDGKSITAINVAGAMALKSQRVLLMDADFRRSTIHLQLGLPESPGLSEVLVGTHGVEEALVHAEQFPGLYVLSAGGARANPVELLDNSRWPALCAEIREMFDYVILDSPPMGSVADYDLIQSVCDGLILVARPDHTSRRLCLKALQGAPKDKLIGVLLNCVAKWFLGKYTTPDYYYYAGGRYYKQ